MFYSFLYKFKLKQYKFYGLLSTSSKFQAIAGDCQTFLQAILLLRVLKPTGADENKNFLMAIYLHLPKITTVTYEYQYYYHVQWSNHFTLKTLQDE